MHYCKHELTAHILVGGRIFCYVPFGVTVIWPTRIARLQLHWKMTRTLVQGYYN